jgi:hypothetical protein
MGAIHQTHEKNAPFLVLGLPRSRTAWLSRFLNYGDHHCGHEQARYWRSLDDAKAYLGQSCIGTCETAVMPFWRLLDHIAPCAKIVIVRRPVHEVFSSLTALDIGFDGAALRAALKRLDRKLDQIEARCDNVLSVKFADLAHEETCRAVWEHCLPYPFDHAHWAALEAVNIQCDMRAMMRYAVAHAQPLAKLASVAKHHSLMAMQKPVEAEGFTFQAESFDTWIADAQALFDRHLVLVGEAPGDWRKKNLPMMKMLSDSGAMQITTARSNGRMFGYLMTLISPSLTGEGITSAYNTTFYASPDMPGLGSKIQREAIRMLKERGVHDVFFETGQRGSGPRLGALYRRLGAVEHGQVYRLPLEA